MMRLLLRATCACWRFLWVEAHSRSLGYARDDKSLGGAVLLSGASGRQDDKSLGGAVLLSGASERQDDKSLGNAVLLSGACGRQLCQVAVVVVALLFCAGAQATTWNVTTSSNLQSVINGASAGDTISFAAGTYSLGSGLTGKCGITYTGPAIPISQYTAGDGKTYWGYYGQTAILSSTFGTGGAILNFYNGGSWANPCSQPTVVQYLSFMNSGGIYMQASYTNVTFQYNNFGNIPGDTGPYPDSTGIYLDGGNQGSNTAQTFTNITIQWNRIGDTNSCLSPTNAYADVSSPDGDGNAGGCNGTIINSSLNGVSYLHNNFLHVSEGTHINCPGGNNPGQGASPCEPSSNGATTHNLVVEYNDFSQTHRMDWEEQPQTTSGVVMQWNSLHDKLNTPGFSFGFSMACCIVGSTSPQINLANNVIAWNLPPASGNRYGYGIEAWGNQGNYNNNWLGIASNYPAAAAITWGWDGAAPSAGLYSVSNNTVCNGASWGGYQYSVKEVSQSITPTVQTGNNFTPNACTAVTSVAPTISPASGTFTTSQTVTFTDPGYSSGPQPLGNTGIWYTTDGSTPVPASHGTYIASGGTIAVSTTTTVKAIGMWGAQNQPGSYASGMGFTPSAVVSATYTSGTPPTLNSVSLTAAGSVTSIAVGASVQISAACHYNNGTTTGCNTTDAYGNSVSTWNTSNAGIVSLSSSGLAGGVAIGTANLTAVVAGVTSPAFSLAVTAPSVTLSSITLATTGGITSIVAGSTNQLIATCHYSDGSTTTCTTTDSHGNAVSTWTSAATTIATVSSGGLVTGVAAGSTNLSAVAAGITSSPLVTLTVTAAPPTLQGGYLGTPGSANTMYVGGTLQFSAYCQYSNSTTTNCSVPDIYGNGVTQWLSSNPAEVTVGAVGSASPGLATAVATGSPNIQAYVGTVHLNEWVLYISNPPVSLTGLSLATTGGVTGVFVGFTNQLVATCTYSDGSTTNCSTTDSHGNVAGNYTSSNTSLATVGAGTGLVTGVAGGTTNLTAQAGGFTSSPLPLSVIAVPSGTYTITITGPVTLSGTVHF